MLTTPSSFEETRKQREAHELLGSSATHILLYGGSRSGKTFKIIKTIVSRALAAPHSRHAVLRFRFNHCKHSIIFDTFPKVMRICFPNVQYKLDRSDWYVTMGENSQIWFGGLDDKERTEKILGNEYATIFLNECSQIPFSSRNLALTRLAQKCEYAEGKFLRRKFFYDENPPSQAHWSYRMFIKKTDPDTGRMVDEPENFAYMKMNPEDNLENLPDDYIKTLASLPSRMRIRFLKGEFSDVTDAYWSMELIEKWRVVDGVLPDMQRVVIAVDPSGAADTGNETNDAIGIVVAGLGTDGNGYLLEDLTVKAGPKTWGNVVTTAYDRWRADKVVGEINYGGEMVNYVIQSCRPRTPFEKISASRGKVVRAEPISALSEEGKIRFAGNFNLLEEELCSFTKNGYIGSDSPNRADAFVWAFTSLFPGIIRKPVADEVIIAPMIHEGGQATQSWMAA